MAEVRLGPSAGADRARALPPLALVLESQNWRIAYLAIGCLGVDLMLETHEGTPAATSGWFRKIQRMPRATGYGRSVLALDTGLGATTHYRSDVFDIHVG